MKKIITLFLLFLVFACSAQSAGQSVVGTHAGYFNWAKAFCTLELCANSTYVLKMYDQLNMEVQSSIKGKWRAEGDRLILTDVAGDETVICRYSDQWLILSPSGYSWVAKFQPNKSLLDFRAEQRKQGC